MALFRPFIGDRCAPAFYAFVLQAIGGVLSLAWCPHVVSQAPQHSRSSWLLCMPVYLLYRFF